MPVIQQGTAMIRASPMHCAPTIASESAAMAESTQHKLDRVRPPRVQITYDVEIGNAIEKKELPLVVGILADLSGKPDTPPAKLVERRFVDIDRDNFNEILSSISPRHPAGRQHHQRRRQQAERRVALQPHRGLRPGQPGEAGGPVASPVRGAPAPARPADQARRQRRPRPVAAGRGGQHRRPAGNQSGPPGSRSGPGRRQRTPADQPA